VTTQHDMQRQRAAARAVLFAAHHRYGQKVFRVDRHGSNWEPLHWAATFGWCWFVTEERCAILEAGMREIEPYRQPTPCTSWICPCCLSVVSQPDGETGLPENVRCETCAQAGVEAAERMRQRVSVGPGRSEEDNAA
jgi:hypothetical protein